MASPASSPRPARASSGRGVRGRDGHARVAGFGATSVIHTAHLVDLSADLPIVVEVVDDQEHVDKLMPILDEMLGGGALVTLEKVRVLKYRAAERGARPGGRPPPASPSSGR